MPVLIPKESTLRKAGTCDQCHANIPKGAKVWWGKPAVAHDPNSRQPVDPDYDDIVTSGISGPFCSKDCLDGSEAGIKGV
jgi:hypothetical protein